MLHANLLLPKRQSNASPPRRPNRLSMVIGSKPFARAKCRSLSSYAARKQRPFCFDVMMLRQKPMRLLYTQTGKSPRSKSAFGLYVQSCSRPAILPASQNLWRSQWNEGDRLELPAVQKDSVRHSLAQQEAYSRDVLGYAFAGRQEAERLREAAIQCDDDAKVS